VCWGATSLGVRTDGIEHREALEVRLVRADEVGRFNDLLDEHHFLGHHLFGVSCCFRGCHRPGRAGQRPPVTIQDPLGACVRVGGAGELPIREMTGVLVDLVSWLVLGMMSEG